MFDLGDFQSSFITPQLTIRIKWGRLTISKWYNLLCLSAAPVDFKLRTQFKD